jgi:hypothetical protein
MKILSSKAFGQESIKVLIFGQSGHGKTTMCATTLEPTLIISAESGLLSIAGSECDVIDLAQDDQGKLVPKEDRIARLMEVYKFIQTDEVKKKYKWICLDSLTEIGQNLVEKCQKDFPDRKDGMVLWGEYAKGMRGIIKAFRDLSFYNVVFTALSIEEKDENGKRLFAIDLNGKIAQQLPQFFDEVLFLHVAKNEAGEQVRKLLCNPVDTVPYAKDRSGKLEKFEEPNLAKIAMKIRNKPKEK